MEQYLKPTLSYNNGSLQLNIPSAVISERFGECGINMYSEEDDMSDITLEVARRIAKKLKVGLWLGNGCDFMPDFDVFEDYTGDENG